LVLTTALTTVTSLNQQKRVRDYTAALCEYF
jgi:hypothetical protein